MMRKIRKTLFLLTVLGLMFSSCKRDERAEEEKLSPSEKVEIAKDLLEVGLLSDAKRLFSESLPSFSKDECKQGKVGKTCYYCDALYGKFLADFYGTLKLLEEFLQRVIKEEKKETQSPISPKEEKQDVLASQSVEMLLGTLLKKIDTQRQDLLTIIENNCEFQSGATVTLKILTLEFVIPARTKKEEEFLYSSLFAELNYMFLSLAAGIIDILYSQNFSISVTQSLTFLKDLLKFLEKSPPTHEILKHLGDFFTKNPAILTQNDQRVYLWGKSATDIASSFDTLSRVFLKIEDSCLKKTKEDATFYVIDSIIDTLISAYDPDLKSMLRGTVDFCEILNILKGFLGNERLVQNVSDLLSKIAKAIRTEMRCKTSETTLAGTTVKTIERKPSEEDGCVRLPDDIIKIIPLRDIIQGIFPTPFALDLSAFFSVPTAENPKNLRALLPLVQKEDEKFLFAIQKDPETDPFDNLELYTIAKGAPHKVDQKVSFPKACVKSKLYIAFADPTFFGSLYYYATCKDDSSLNLGSPTYFQLPVDLRKGNFAINGALSKIIPRT